VKRGLCIAIVAAAVCVAIPGAASAAPPVLQTVGFDQATKVLSATWSLPPGVQTGVIEANTNPALDSQGYFLFGANDGYYGSNVIFDLPGSAATSWVHSYPDLPAGHYYVHVSGYDTTCDRCAIPEWTTLGAFDVNPPPPRPRYQASVRSIHPGAIALPGNWTYSGDTVRLRFRNATARAADVRVYRACYTYRRGVACRSRKIVGRRWDSWRLRVKPAMAAGGRGYIGFTWRVNQHVVARKWVNWYSE
jgi:hypothetical protein